MKLYFPVALLASSDFRAHTALGVSWEGVGLDHCSTVFARQSPVKALVFAGSHQRVEWGF